jgi:hypothetical protein
MGWFTDVSLTPMAYDVERLHLRRKRPMKLSATVMAMAALGLSALGWTSASAQAKMRTASPIQVLNFQYNAGSSDDEPGGQPEEGLMLTFKNVSPKTAHVVAFAVVDASGFRLGTVDRHGTFSPGVDITRYFGQVKMKHKHGVPANARAIEVIFDDGTSWHRK